MRTPDANDVLKALRGSMVKWKRLSGGRGMDRGGANCPLCRLFNNDVTLRAGYACHGCPVADYSGARGCSDTPYDGWKASFSSRLTPADRAVAKREYEFLKEVRDWWLKRITENREKI